MEHTKNANNNDSCECKNGYTSSEMFMESFGKDDESILKCDNCPSFVYTGGICRCSKFN